MRLAGPHPEHFGHMDRIAQFAAVERRWRVRQVLSIVAGDIGTAFECSLLASACKRERRRLAGLSAGHRPVKHEGNVR